MTGSGGRVMFVSSTPPDLFEKSDPAPLQRSIEAMAEQKRLIEAATAKLGEVRAVLAARKRV
jgi:hypothetical protein